MPLKGALFRAIKKRSTFEKREALKIQKLREQRIKEEGKARLKTIEAREKARIRKAKMVGKPKKKKKGRKLGLKFEFG